MAKDQVTEQHLRRAWQSARRSIDSVVSVLGSELSLDRAHYIPSKNALIPLVYYVAKDKSRTKATRQMLRFFMFSELSERYGSGAETVVRKDFRMLTDQSGTVRSNLEYLAKSVAADARQYYRGLKVRTEDVAGAPSKNVMLLLMYVLMKKLGATDWGGGPFTPLGEIDQVETHLHHIFPFNFMMTDPAVRGYAGKTKLNPREFRETVNDIANLTFLRGSTNARIGDAPPWQYLTQETTKEMRRAHFIPEDHSLWAPDRFGDFLEARAALIAKAATRLLKSLS